VIGTVGSEEKAAFAASHGCHYPILYREQDFAEQVRQITDGKGVDVVGQATFMKSLDCLRPMGTMVSFGQASGPVEPLHIGVLAAKGSLLPHSGRYNSGALAAIPTPQRVVPGQMPQPEQGRRTHYNAFVPTLERLCHNLLRAATVLSFPRGS
jgi:NADPH:quinone reductase-like Zn-dependent oxidoreductase